jgi:hypothetical protein
MNTVKIWRPGTDTDLDQLFEDLRLKQFNNTSDPLASNYEKDIFTRSLALSISFDSNNNPTHCSSIIHRNCWPDQVYRILNRMWKIDRISITKFVSPQICLMVAEQFKWLKENTNCELVFVSRQYSNWRNMLIRDFDKYSGLTFKTDNYKYLTCPNFQDKSCWQHIIYYGDEQCLKLWNHK